MAEDFGKKIERFGQDIWKKTTDAVGSIGKSAEAANKARELKGVYANIGKQFCEKHPGQAADEFAELAGRAKELEAEISVLQEQILEQRGSKKCVSCGEQIPLGSTFCSKCGAAQPQSDPEPEEPADDETEVVDGWTCPACGAKLGNEDAFCTACGAKRP